MFTMCFFPRIPANMIFLVFYIPLIVSTDPLLEALLDNHINADPRPCIRLQIDGSTLKTLCMQHGPRLYTFHAYLSQGVALVKRAHAHGCDHRLVGAIASIARRARGASRSWRLWGRSQDPPEQRGWELGLGGSSSSNESEKRRESLLCTCLRKKDETG